MSTLFWHKINVPVQSAHSLRTDHRHRMRHRNTPGMGIVHCLVSNNHFRWKWTKLPAVPLPAAPTTNWFLGSSCSSQPKVQVLLQSSGEDVLHGAQRMGRLISGSTQSFLVAHTKPARSSWTPVDADGERRSPALLHLKVRSKDSWMNPWHSLWARGLHHAQHTGF